MRVINNGVKINLETFAPEVELMVYITLELFEDATIQNVDQKELAQLIGQEILLQLAELKSNASRC